jgi:hypothetical protein
MRENQGNFTRAFKRESNRLMNSSYHPTAEIAADLGIRRPQLYMERTTVDEKSQQCLTGKRRRARKEDQSELSTQR